MNELITLGDTIEHMTLEDYLRMVLVVMGIFSFIKNIAGISSISGINEHYEERAPQVQVDSDKSSEE